MEPAGSFELQNHRTKDRPEGARQSSRGPEPVMAINHPVLAKHCSPPPDTAAFEKRRRLSDRFEPKSFCRARTIRQAKGRTGSVI